MRHALFVILILFTLTFQYQCNKSDETVRFTELRSEYKTLSKNQVKSMIKSKGFFDYRWNKTRSFVNQFELKENSGDKIVIDHATDLVWHQSGSEIPIQYSEVSQWLEELNKKGYAGYTYWRLPTLEEAASLVAQEKTNFRYMDPIFSSLQYSIHTGDFFSEFRIWGVSFQFGGSFRVGVRDLNYIRPVTKYLSKNGLRP